MTEQKERLRTITIKGDDFVIKYSSGSYILLVPTKGGKWKIEGYFTQVESAIRRIYNIRKNPKYKLGGSIKEAKEVLDNFKAAHNKLQMMSLLIFKPIKKLEEEIFGTNRRLG